jgi:hypothetical protein
MQVVSAHPHMLRNACGFELANDGDDTRARQHHMGHQNITPTVRYNEMAPDRSRGAGRTNGHCRESSSRSAEPGVDHLDRQLTDFDPRRRGGITNGAAPTILPLTEMLSHVPPAHTGPHSR